MRWPWPRRQPARITSARSNGRTIEIMHWGDDGVLHVHEISAIHAIALGNHLVGLGLDGLERQARVKND